MACCGSLFFQTKAAEELRKVVASLKKDVQASEGANASLEKTLIDQQENERQSTLKVFYSIVWGF